MKLPRLFLLDGYSLAFRAFFALPLLTTGSGRYTNATYGFAMMLTRLLEDYEPEYIAVAMDKGRPTVRLQRYPEYKGTRDKTPTEMAEQIPYIKEVLRAYRIPILEYEGYEADDIIGTLSVQAAEAGLETRIVTGDRDALQLVTPSVAVLLTKKGITEMEMYDVAAIEKRYGLQPSQLADLKALMGDKSDNIPGIPGIGIKTGIKLLKAAGDLDTLLQQPDHYATKRQLELLRTYHDQAVLSRELATIVCDLPLGVDVADLQRQPVDYQQLAAVYTEYELKSLLDKLPSESVELMQEEQGLEVGRWHLVDNQQLFSELKQTVRRNGRCAIAFAGGEEGKYCCAISPQPELTYLLSDLDQIAELLSQEETEWVGHDLKSVAVAMAQAGLQLPLGQGDTLLAAYLLNPSLNNYDLSRLVELYLDAVLPVTDEDPQADLAASCVAVWPLLGKLEKELEDKGLDYLYRQIELPLSHVLADMERQGVFVDVQQLQEMQADLQGRLADIMQGIYEAAGEEFNINSPKQLSHILFEKLHLPVIKRTKTGYSTDAEVLEALSDEHIVVSQILEYRQLAKLKSTYLDGLLQVVESDSKVHTTYHQTVTTTGRLSSSEPNLQNIPIRLEEGRQIRRAFCPSPGRDYILAADYSQIELRILAHMSQDPILMKAFLHDEDIHARTAAEVFGVALDEVTPAMRSRAKAVNFGIVYGISDYGLSRDLKIPRSEAKEYIDRYFQRYAGVRNYIDKVIVQARQDGYVTTLLKRRRYLPNINSRNYNLRSFAERTAMNTPIQGSAADLIKLAMVRIHRRLQQEGYASKMILQVHDELIFEVCQAELTALAGMVQKEMETALQLLVPLRVDIKVGTNWYNVAPYEAEL